MTPDDIAKLIAYNSGARAAFAIILVLGCSSSSPRCRCGLTIASSATTVASKTTESEPSSSGSTLSTPANTDLAILRTLTPHHDKRGNVRETFRASWFPMVPPIKQLVRSNSRPRTLRGMHLHRKQWDIWHFVEGRALVRLYYHDEGSNHFVEMSPRYALAIPPGVSHGFYTKEGCVLMYALTEEYDGSDEYGWYFSDGLKKLEALDWPNDPSDLRISMRDLGAMRLAEFRA